MKMSNLFMKIGIALGLFFSVLFMTEQALAQRFILPGASNDVIGSNKTIFARDGQTLADIGRENGVGYYEMVNANPHISPVRRLSTAWKVLIPGQFILPPGERKGIVINLAELRLYYYPEGTNIVITHPVGIGKENGWETPTGVTKVIKKEEDPIWRPTVRVRAEAARRGYPIPKVFPPGPDNPLGRHLLRLGWHTYLIHGTNQVQSIGGRVSAGCIRLLPDAIQELYDMVPVGTQVRVINQPFKAGWSKGRLYLKRILHWPSKKKNLRMSQRQSTNPYSVNLAITTLVLNGIQ